VATLRNSRAVEHRSGAGFLFAAADACRALPGDRVVRRPQRMTTETLAALKVGVLTALGSVAIEQAQPSALPMVVPVVSGLLGAGIAYGILKGAVDTLNRQVADFARELAAIRETTHATAERVARIEGTMERRGAPRV
jgi:hypothetical protein